MHNAKILFIPNLSRILFPDSREMLRVVHPKCPIAGAISRALSIHLDKPGSVDCQSWPTLQALNLHPLDLSLKNRERITPFLPSVLLSAEYSLLIPSFSPLIFNPPNPVPVLMYNITLH
jgi:hypothetical protein